MTSPIPYADYVRIEIHAGGKKQIIELTPDDWSKVTAKVEADYPPTRDAGWGGMLREVPAGPLCLTLEASGPMVVITRGESDRVEIPQLR